MTFEEFQGTRREVNDLEQELGISIYSDPNIKCPGLVYEGNLYIEKTCDNWTEAARSAGQYHLVIHNLTWLTNDLELLERALYDFYTSEWRR